MVFCTVNFISLYYNLPTKTYACFALLIYSPPNLLTFSLQIAPYITTDSKGSRKIIVKSISKDNLNTVFFVIYTSYKKQKKEAERRKFVILLLGNRNSRY
jgi:hypothetical protein